MTYSDKVNKSKDLRESILSLKDGQELVVDYGKDRDGKPNQYRIKAYNSIDEKMSYSIWDSFRGMNIEKIGRTTMKGYTYDMMSQKTTYTFPLYNMKSRVKIMPKGTYE